MLAQWLMQDWCSFQYQGPMPNLLSHKQLDCHPSVGNINMFFFAADKEESNDPKIPSVEWRGATNKREIWSPSDLQKIILMVRITSTRNVWTHFNFYVK